MNSETIILREEPFGLGTSEERVITVAAILKNDGSYTLGASIKFPKDKKTGLGVTIALGRARKSIPHNHGGVLEEVKYAAEIIRGRLRRCERPFVIKL